MKNNGVFITLYDEETLKLLYMHDFGRIIFTISSEHHVSYAGKNISSYR